MNNLEKLLKELCPSGIEYQSLGEIAFDIYRGSGITRNQVTKDGTPCVRYGEIYTTYDIWFDNCVSFTDENLISNKKYFEYGDVLFAITGERVDEIAKSCVYIGHEKCLAGGDIVVLKHNQNPKYMSYVLSTAAARAQKSKGKVKSKVVHSSVPAIKGIVIPVPPLPIQEEIVRILDTFTELTAELTTELTAERTARKRQYEYYRDELFKFCDSSSVKWKSISELGMLERGGGLQKRDLTISGVGCIHYGQIYTFYGTYVDKTKSFVSKELACRLKKIKKNDLLIAITSENIKDVCKCVAWIGEEEIVTGGHTAIFRHSQNPKYISYFFQTSSFFKQKQKIANVTKVTEVSPIKLSKVLIPIPSIEEQNRIVSILDRFDTLCNNLTSDLPAEIEARKKQYEYYRDKLLTFKELKQ